MEKHFFAGHFLELQFFLQPTQTKKSDTFASFFASVQKTCICSVLDITDFSTKDIGFHVGFPSSCSQDAIRRTLGIRRTGFV